MKSKVRRESRHRGGASGASLFRRRNNRIDLLSDFKNDLDTSKDIYQLLREQLLSDEQSPWRAYELLYVVIVNRKKKSTGNTQTGINTVEVQHGHNKHERYLVLLKRPDSSTGFALIRVVKKENELEYKSSYDLAEVKSLDYGSDETELLIQQESADHSVYFSTQGDRDETLWILMQIIKLVTGSDIPIGYSVDVDGLAYMIANSGIFTRFPQLQKVISLSSTNFHDQFSADEAEAEHILDEINWGSSLSGQKDLQSILSQRSDKLNNEIIDFLLQWEEMDEAADAKGADATSTRTSARQPTSVSSSSMLGMRDTREVLKALSMVDDELKAVETWLGDQIKKLSSIKSNLSLIEDESGGLETSWQNLNVVQQVVALLIEKYSFEDFEENLLKSPDAVINSALKASSLNVIEQTLDPLIKAGKRLRAALVVKQVELHGISAADWKQIQAIAAISTRKEQLMSIADIFCSKFGEVALVLFDKLLKHKALQEGDSGTGTSGRSQAITLIPKSFTSRAILEQVSASTVYFDIAKFFSKASNQLLESQALFHNNLVKFSDLLDLQAELASASTRPLCEAYIRATHDRLYAPLIKAFTKDLQSNVTLKQQPMTISSASKYKLNSKNDLQIFFHSSQNARPSSTGKLITSWKCFEAAIILLAPVIVSEEHFIKKLFHLDGRRGDNNDQTNQSVSLTIDEATFLQSRLHTMLEAVFEGCAERLMSLSAMTSSNALNPTIVASQEAKDGIESIAMLACLTQYSESFNDSVQAFERNENYQQFLFLGSTLYLMKILKVLKLQLEQNILSFANEQISWIQNQRADPKSPEVLSPFLRFPTIVMHVIQMINGKTFECVDELLVKMARELLSWLTTVSKSNEKYVDKVKLTNLVYFHLSLSELNVPCLQQFITYAQQQIQETSVRYINWMVEYEFPSLSALAVRIDGIGKKVNDEDLSLYIRRKDVLSVIKELENKTLDSLVSSLSKRIEKHFKCETDSELNLMGKMWTHLKERIVGIVKKLEAAASTSYQIKLDITPSQLSDIFDKYALTMRN